MDAHHELVQSARGAARAARGVLAAEMESLSQPLQERVSEVIQKLFAVEVGKLEAITRGIERSVVRLLELASEDGASSAFAQALTLLFPLSQELQRALDPEMVTSGPQPILLQPARRKDELERRRGPRIGLEVDIGMHSDTNFFTGFSGDVSEGGMFVATYSPLSVGTRIELSFVLPGGYHVVTEGDVTWVRDPVDRETSTPGMGVRFKGLSEEDRAMIARFAEEREPIFFER